MPGEVEGFIGTEEVVLKNAATETTLQLLVQAVNAANPNKGSAARLQKMYEDAVKGTTQQQYKNLKNLKEENDKREDLNKLLDEEKEKRRKFIEDLDGMSMTLGRGFVTVFSAATPKLADLTSALSGIPILGPVIGALGQVSQDTIDNFRQLSTVGADLGDNLTDVRHAAAFAGLSLDDFRNAIVNNAKTIAALEGDSTRGIQRFTRLSNYIMTNVQPSLAKLGFSMDETAQGMTTYIELQQQIGRSQRMTDLDLRLGTTEYLYELDLLSRATGLQRRELMDMQRRQLQDKNIKNVLLGMETETRKEYQRLLPALEAAGVNTEVFAKLVASNGRGLDETSRNYARLYPEIARQAAAFKQNRGSYEDTVAAFEAAAESARSQDKAVYDLASTLGVLGKTYLDPIREMAGVGKIAKEVDTAAKAQLDAVETASKSAANVDQTLLNLRNTFMSYLSPVLETFLNSVGGFSGLMDPNSEHGKRLKEFMTQVGNYFEKLSNVMKTEGVTSMFSTIANDIVDALVPVLGRAIYELFTNPYVLGTIGLAFSAAIAKAMIVSKISSMVGGGGVSGGVGRGAATLGTGVGRGARGLGTGIGQGIGGLLSSSMQGLATGLAAFANPKILLGASIFSGSIAIIGGGLSAASYLLGRSLPTLVDGMKSIETLDGTKLTDAGAGLAAVGAGLAVFGTMGTLGTVGSVIGSVVDGIAGLFGAKSPVEKLQEFATVGNELGKSAEGFKSFKLAITDMPLGNLNFTNSQLANLDIGTAKIKKLGTQLAAVRTEMKSISNPSITETVSSAIKDIGATISAKLGGTEPGEKSVEQLMTELNTKVDRLNINMVNLVAIQERVAPSVEKTATYAKRNAGNIRPG